MRGPWLALIVVMAIARVAMAGHSIVVLSDPAQQGPLGSAMQVALAGRGVAIATLAAPTGELRLERAALAQRAALQLGADAAVWIDDGDVCAVSADGRAFRHAPLPPALGDAMPRAFSAIATSLLDELIAPPEPAPNIDVDVHVHVNGQDQNVTGFVNPRPEATPVDPFAAPGVVAAMPAPGIPHPDRTVLEVGPMLSPITAGLSAEVAFPLSPKYRLGVIGGASRAIGDDVYVLNAGLELRDVGVLGSSNHLDLSGEVGIASAHDGGTASGWDSIFYIGPRIGYVWEGAGSYKALALTALVATDGRDTVPGAYATFRLGLAL